MESGPRRNQGFGYAYATTLPVGCCASRTQTDGLYEPRDGRAERPHLSVRRKEDTMATGTVKWFNAQKGFGFIQPDDGGKDVFVHVSAVERAGMYTLNEGQKVNFEITTERGKTAATNLSAV
jgi:CspA family cold shock protein